jgi:hypothetical protein
MLLGHGKPSHSRFYIRLEVISYCGTRATCDAHDSFHEDHNFLSPLLAGELLVKDLQVNSDFRPCD